MRVGAGLCAVLLRAAATGVVGGLHAATAVGPQEREQEEAEEKRGGAGFLWRSFQQAKLFGETIDPNAVAQVEQAWKELAPDLRQAADDIVRPDLRKVVDDVLQGTKDIQAAGQEAGGVWSDIKQAVSELGGGGSLATDEESSGLGWEALKRDAKRAARGVFGDVFGEVADEILVTFETRLSEALSEGNIRAASQLWHRLLDTPEVKVLARERWLWAGAERAVRQHLSGYMSEGSAMKVERAVNATTEFALQFAGHSRNAGKSDLEVFDELSYKFCHLQGAVEKLWPLAVRALPVLGYEDYAASAESAIRSHVLSRITLTVSASALLLGLNPRNDPFLMAVIASFSLGHLTKDVAQNMAAFFQKVFVDQATFGQQQQQPSDEFLVADAEGGWPSTSLVDLAAELVNGTSTCEELGHQAFAFFKVVQRALAELPSSESQGADVGTNDVDPTVRASPAWREATPPPQLHEQHKPPGPTRKLNLDGLLLRQAIWAAAVVDNKNFVVCLAVGAFLCCVLASVCCWRWLGSRGCASRNRKGGWGVRVHGMPQRVSAKQREKTA